MTCFRKPPPVFRLSVLLGIAASLTFPMWGQPSAHRSAATAAERPEVKNVFWQPDEVKQGSPVLITVELSGPGREVTGTWLGKRIRFAPSDKPRQWVALAGADVDQAPGTFELKVRATIRGHIAQLRKPIEVKEAEFGTGEVKVAQDYVNPTPDEQKQIAHDDVLKGHAFAGLIARQLWNGNFIKPVDAESTPSFGETRMMNEEKTSRHLGTDFPVKEGTRVDASNAGVVALAAPLFYEGNCVILDHGDGLFTVYMHLEKMMVHRGERVRKHAPIGLSGRTGRVTGPHLHFEVVWNKSHLDPLELIALTLPDRKARAASHGTR
jgi:murein DD-endopeptidase MepM/ murein hydrolase activator NlpD